MENFKNKVRAFLLDEEGLTVVEYVIGAALLVALLTGVFTNLGSNLGTKLDSIVNNIDDGASG